MPIEKQVAGSGAAENGINQHARKLIEEMNGLLQNIYADLEVSRASIRSLTDKGKAMAEDIESWPGGDDEAREFLTVLEALDRKINQTLDLKKLKDAGLVKTVKF